MPLGRVAQRPSPVVPHDERKRQIVRAERAQMRDSLVYKRSFAVLSSLSLLSGHVRPAASPQPRRRG